MNWNIGDRAIIHGLKKHPELNGTLCTIVSLTSQYLGQLTVDADNKPYTSDNHWKGWAISPENLRPIYDSNELVTWASCVWQPKETVS